MPILSVDSIAKQYSERILFTQVSFGLEARDRVGVIGTNGSGKSSLLRIIAGVEQPDNGRVTRTGGLRVGYLPQNPSLDPQRTVLEEIFAGDSETMRLLRAYERLSMQLERHPDDAPLHNQVSALMTQLDATGAWDAETRARTVLSRLGIDELDRPVGLLSGGQRRRVAMAASLIDQPDLLLLDEPTNHIDTETIAWLEAELARWSGALMLVTHDRYFLDRVVMRMLEIDAGQVRVYTGGYASFLEQKAEQAVRAEESEQARQNLIRRELAWLRRGARARSTKQKAHVERARNLVNERGPERTQDLTIVTAAGRRLGSKVLRLKGVSKSFGTQTVVRNLTYTVEPGDRIGIIGPNGSGKTTLLNLIAGRVLPDQGEVEVGETVQLGYYDQESVGLNEAQRVLDYVREGAEQLRNADGDLLSAEQLLERFLFPRSTQYGPIEKLSGGERRRLYLLRTLMFAPNLLLLDEPTNDLDIATLQVLEDYLDGFSGTLIIVSHDRYFLDRTVQRLLVFEGDGRVVEYPGGYSSWADERREQVAAEKAVERPTAVKPVAPKPAPASDARPRRLNTKEQRELAELERRIPALEARQAAITAQLAAGGDYREIERLSAELALLGQEVEAAMERWVELSERAL